MDPLKYIFQKSMPSGKLAKWKIYMTHKVVKGQALTDHLVENPVGREYEPLTTYFPDEEVSFVGEDIVTAYDGWRIFFDRAANFKEVGHLHEHPGIIGNRRLKLADTSVTRRMGHQEYQDTVNEFEEVLATLSSMIQHPNQNYIDPIPIEIRKKPDYCAHVEDEFDRNPWFHDIREYLEKGEYLENATHNQKHTLHRLENHLFQRGGIFNRRTPDIGLLRCVDVKEASRLLEEIHAGTCGLHMNGYVLAKKILSAGYFWITMETDYIKYVQKYHQCQIHADMTWVAPNELNVTSSPWPFATRGMDVIGPIEHVASNGNRFILVAIDYFTKWVEAVSYKAVTKKVIAYFVRDFIVCLFGLPKSIITDNATNLNSDLMKAMCETLKIKHKISTMYRP
ncbi:uncharacterized protein [Nicotiana tomentosiformis]|uniref:uncharacterized protein n=1 Tax=Nicotiana tomentosiformis TaxID=4098 RepID=UPI00388CCB6D